eukprot:GHVU01217138.1.p1 GENE.GHVU01217138.1~~GHVU01217138.1.p1  ORF type:complete len:387 (+),score=30.29 GHVU01217138.1:627-1787(+)
MRLLLLCHIVAPTEALPNSATSNPNPITATVQDALKHINRQLVQLPQVVVSRLFRAQDERAAHEKRAAEVARVKGNRVEEIAEAHDLAVLPESKQLRCRPCAQYGGNHYIANSHVEGVFKMDQPLPALKRSVARHLLEAGHQRAVKQAKQVQASAQRRFAQGLTNGRAVYHTLKEGNSYTSYERLLNLLSLCGVDVGTLNHSRRFCSSLARTVRSVIEEEIRSYMDKVSSVTGRKPCVAMNADKSTNLRRTGQVVGAIALIDGELQSIMLANAVVSEQSGDAEGLARLIMDAGATLMPLSELRKRVMGYAFDGQYICMHVSSVLLRIVGGSPSWITTRWDVPHLLECGVRDCTDDRQGTEKLETVAWFGELPKTIAALLTKCQYGK